MDDDTCVMNYIEIVPLTCSVDTHELPDVLSSLTNSPELPDFKHAVQVKVEPGDVGEEYEEVEDVKRIDAVCVRPQWNAHFPSVSCRTRADNETTVNDRCEQQRDERDVLSHSNEVVIEDADVKKEADDVLFSEMSELFRAPDVPQIDDTERICNSNTCDPMYKNASAEKALECNVCHKAFKYPCELNRHAFLHTGIKPYVCHVCAMAFSRPSDLKRHSYVHSSVKRFACDVCDKAFREGSNLMKHKRIHAVVKPYKCDVCQMSFSEASKLNKHQCVHSGIRQYTCEICDKNFSSGGNLTKHKRIHTGVKPYVCEVCDKSFRESHKLNVHRHVHSGIKQFTCDICDKAFKYPRNLSVHKRIHCGMKPVNCHASLMPDTTFTLASCTTQTDNVTSVIDNCEQETNEGNVTDSNVVSSSDVYMKEEQEGMLFGEGTSQLYCLDHGLFRDADVYQVDDAERISAGNTSCELQADSSCPKTQTREKSHECDVCHKLFKQSGHLYTHKRTHTGLKPYVCDVCDKAFSRASNLNMHKRVHTGIKPYICGVCDMAFSRGDNLKTHMYVHTGARQFACDVCGRAFNNVSVLTMHKRIHSGVKPYVCYVCGMAFSRGHDLKRHTYLHSAVKRFTCDMCDRAFKHFRDLTGHRRRIHGDIKPLGCGTSPMQDTSCLPHTSTLDKVASVNDQCEQQLNEIDVSWNVSNSNTADGHNVDIKEEEDNVLFSETTSQCNSAGRQMFLDAEVRQVDDSDHNTNTCDQTHKNSASHRAHTAERSHECSVCHKTFKYPSDLNRHSYVHSGIKRFTCDICDKAFSEVGNLTKHKRVHTGVKPYTCDVCNKAFSQGSKLNEHRHVHSGVKRFTCDICDKAFKHLRNLTLHKQVHSGMKPLSCSASPVQDTGFPLVLFTAQADIEQEPDDREVSSNVSRSGVSQSDDNYVKQEEDDRLLCETTSELYNADDEMCRGADASHVDGTDRISNSNTSHQTRRDFASLEKQIPEKSYGCDLCHKTFKRSCHLYMHKRIHTGLKPYVCDVCEMAFSRASTLNTHKRVHTGVRPYTCGKCDMAFSSSHNLKRHSYIHSGVKRFTCEVCDRAFKDQGVLTIHKRIHSGVKPYVCCVCGMAFSRGHDLKRHTYLHCAVKRFTCDMCDRAFKHFRDLTGHRRRIHRDIKALGCGTSPMQDTSCLPFLSCTSRLENGSSINDSSDRHPNERDDSSYVSHSIAMEGDSVDVKVDANALFTETETQLCSSGYEMFRGAELQQLDDIERNTCDQLRGNSSAHEMPTAGKVHECDLCHKTFSCRSHLNTHKRIHTGVKAYMCDLCDMTFSQGSTLNRHRRYVHSGSKRFTCDDCHKAFKHLSDLTRHRRIHGAVKAFSHGKTLTQNMGFSVVSNATPAK